jgi:hypothetical protein
MSRTIVQFDKTSTYTIIFYVHLICHIFLPENDFNMQEENMVSTIPYILQNLSLLYSYGEKRLRRIKHQFRYYNTLLPNT